MGLQEIDPVKREREREILHQLFKCIDESKSLVFDAGAGSGKTYALVESLQYVIQRYGAQLQRHNQKIMCITYTNVAANHVKDKIGNSNLAVVSTIHERLWRLIKGYQKELLMLHKEKMEGIIADDRAELSNESLKIYKTFWELSTEDRKTFEEEVWIYKDEFYQGYSMSADEFRNHFGGYVAQYPNIMDNIKNFRAIVGKLYEIKRYEICVSKIAQGKLRKIEYNAMYNQDRLEWMRISHDTLLEYGKKLILRYPVLQQIIFDQFPYIFIDEYQDTSIEVVEIMAALDRHAGEMQRTFFVGYYGDQVQNIYDDGIGCRLLEYHSGLKKVNKEFNRRSYKEIIDIANKIRLDGMQQNSIFMDCIGGSVAYYDMDSIDAAIEKCKNEWKDMHEGKLHCFVLKNEEVAHRIGISNLYDIFKKSAAYSGAHFQQLNTELLSTDTEKLGKAASFLYRILKFYVDIRLEGTPVEKILYGGVKDNQELNITQLKTIKKNLLEIDGDTLGSYLLQMCEQYKAGSNNIRTIIKAVLDLDKITSDYITGYFMQVLEQQQFDEKDGNEDEDESLNRVRQLLSVSMAELEKWFNYIERNEKMEVIYHTFHGTKGLEFENVLIVLEDGFGKKKEDKVFIKKFLENYTGLETEQQIMKYEKARNLLYVAVTRAKKHLRIIYTGDSVKVKETLDCIFN